MRLIVLVLTILQAVMASRVMIRLARTARGRRVKRQSGSGSAGQCVTVLVPVLNEAERLAPCLKGLTAQGAEVTTILVIDGGSTDGTQTLVRDWERRDHRVRLVDATPVPDGCNGKAHNLQVGLDHAPAGNAWILTVDADVHPDPDLVISLLAHAEAEGVKTLSAATQQSLSGAAEGLVHPAMLATLVYRFGIPGHATNDVHQVQANGQCFLARRELLEEVGGFSAVMDSVCEDVTLARAIAGLGIPVGFYETEGLVTVQMYASWRDAWENWSRSLPMRDRYSGWAGRTGLAEVVLVQALPLWLAMLYHWRLGPRHPATWLNGGLLVARIGVLTGMARAYTRHPWTYWCSPLTDIAVALRIIRMWRRRQHTWRGRPFGSGDPA